MKFLLVEDDKTLATSLQTLLEKQRYLVDIASDGETGLDLAEAFPYDLILLDWMLPRLSGVALCEQLRAKGNRTPIILITARTSSADRVSGLDAGADDYLVKPFASEELLARIRAALRRAEGTASPMFQWGDLYMNPVSRDVRYGSRPIPLTPKEYGLLEVFMRNPRRIFSLENLLDKIWPHAESPYIGAVRTHMAGLRRKLKAEGLDNVVETVYGLGYRLNNSSPPALATTAEIAEIADKSAAEVIDKSTAAETGATTEATTDPAIKDKFGLATLWHSVRESYLQRVEGVEKALQALTPGVPNEIIRQQIVSEAHTLAGSLGSFSFLAVTPQCQAIEQLLCVKVKLSKSDLTQLRQITTQIRQQIEAVPRQPPQAIVKASNPTVATGDTVAQEPPADGAKLLIVDDDPAMLDHLKTLLHPWGFRLKLLGDSLRFEDALEKFGPDLILLDVNMPAVNGFELCQQLRQQPRWYELPVIFLSAYTDADTIQRVFSVGGNDYIRKPIVAPELVARVLSWLARSHTRQRQSTLDSVTGLANQQKSAQDLTRLLSLADRQETAVYFALLAFDDFRAIHQTLAAATGDGAALLTEEGTLKQFGLYLRTAFRTVDVVGRWGGTDFVVGLYGLGYQGGCDRLTDFLEVWQQWVSSEGALVPAIRSGIALYPKDASDLQGLYQVASRSLRLTQESDT